MKKYAKPVIIFENFELNHSIANCSPAMNHSVNSCDYDNDELFGLLEEGETVFSLGTCTYTTDILEDFCMQTGTDKVYNLFTS